MRKCYSILLIVYRFLFGIPFEEGAPVGVRFLKLCKSNDSIRMSFNCAPIDSWRGYPLRKWTRSAT